MPLFPVRSKSPPRDRESDNCPPSNSLGGGREGPVPSNGLGLTSSGLRPAWAAWYAASPAGRGAGTAMPPPDHPATVQWRVRVSCSRVADLEKSSNTQKKHK